MAPGCLWHPQETWLRVHRMEPGRGWKGAHGVPGSRRTDRPLRRRKALSMDVQPPVLPSPETGIGGLDRRRPVPSETMGCRAPPGEGLCATGVWTVLLRSGPVMRVEPLGGGTRLAPETEVRCTPVGGTDSLVVNDLFGQLLEVEPLFQNKEVMRSSYTPDDLPHRDQEIRALGSILVPALRGETPSNVFIYGKTGTGKTACVKYVGKELSPPRAKSSASASISSTSTARSSIPSTASCKTSPTHSCQPTSGATASPSRAGQRTKSTMPCAATWMATPRATTNAGSVDTARKPGEVTIIVLDEVDKLKGDEVLYTLTRINSDLLNNKVSVIGISNDLKFTEFLDPRVKSSLGEEIDDFRPLRRPATRGHPRPNAPTWRSRKDVLRRRRHPPLCCGTGGSRARRCTPRPGPAARRRRTVRARTPEDRGIESQVRMAQNKIELDRISEVVRTLPTQSKLVLLATILGEEDNKRLASMRSPRARSSPSTRTCARPRAATS